MKYIDLSYPISSNFQTYPSDPDIEITKEKDIEKDRTVVHSIKLGTHTGSHVDVPAHIIAGGKTLKDYPLNFFTGKAITSDTWLGAVFAFARNADFFEKLKIMCVLISMIFQH